MAIGDGVSGEGATRHTWDSDVREVVQRTLKRFPHVTANTYVCHPFCGWERRSADFWGAGGRGDSIPQHTGEILVDFLLDLPGRPFIRHYIYQHTLWTSFGGYSRWSRDDHSGILRHVHVTYHVVPPIR